MFLAILVVATMPLAAAPGQPIVASDYPAQSIISGDLTVNVPSFEASLPAIADGIVKASEAIAATKIILLGIMLLLIVLVALSLYSFYKTFVFSPPIRAEIKEFAPASGRGKSARKSPTKKATSKRTRVGAQGFPLAPPAGGQA